MDKHNHLLELLKTSVKVDKTFLETFFNNFNIGDELQFHINEEDVCNYLQIKKETLLNLSNRNQKFILQCDALEKGDGSILLQNNLLIGDNH